MPSFRVFVARKIPLAGLEEVQARYETIVWNEDRPVPYDVLKAEASVSDGIITLLTDHVDAGILDSASKLKVVSNFAAGFNNIDVMRASDLGIAVGNTPDALTEATADTAFALMIDAARGVTRGHHEVVSGRMKPWGPFAYIGQDLTNRTVGIVGMGRIGRAMARRCHLGWNMKVLYSDVKSNKSAESELGAVRVDFQELLRASDFISLHADLNPMTMKMFGREAFATMKRSAVFVNTARGQHVDQEALAGALREGRIFAAGIDVTDPEPLPVAHPLLSIPNLVIAPHIGSATNRTREAMAIMAADNLIAGIEGKPLKAWVNPEIAERRRRG